MSRVCLLTIQAVFKDKQFVIISQSGRISKILCKIRCSRAVVWIQNHIERRRFFTFRFEKWIKPKIKGLIVNYSQDTCLFCRFWCVSCFKEAQGWVKANLQRSWKIQKTPTIGCKWQKWGGVSYSTTHDIHGGTGGGAIRYVN